MNIATAYVEIRADTAAGRREAVTGAKKIADEASAAAEAGNRRQVKSAEDAGNRIRAEQDKTVRKAKSAAQQITEFFAAGVFLKGVNDTVNAASRLQQAVGATEAVFKSSSGVIDDFASNSADAFGISKAAARELTSQIGSMLKGFGFTTQAAAEQSVVLAKLGADLAATFGGQPEEAVQALGAALRGEFDPLERFGISLNVAQANLKAVELGLASNKNEVDLNARAQAALAIIMERSADAQGQFAREADTYAGQQARATAAAEDAKAKFGEQLLPVMTRVQQTVGFLAEGFGELPGPIQLAAVGLVGFVALAGPLQTMGQKAGEVVDSLKKMSTAGIAASATAAGVAAAVVVGYLAYQSLTSKQREVAARAKEVADGLDEATRAALENADAANGAAIANQALSDALSNSGEDGKKLTDALGSLGLTTADALDTLTSLAQTPREALIQLAQQAGLTGEAAVKMADLVNGIEGGLWDADNADQIADRARNWAESFGLVPDQVEAIVRAMEELQDQSEKTALDKIIRSWVAGDAASSKLRQELLGQAEAMTGVNRNGDDLLPLYRAYTGLLKENEFQLKREAEAAGKAGTSIDGLGGSAEDTGRKVSELSDAVGFATGYFNAVDQAASDLASALDDVFGRYTSLEEANRGMAASSDDVAKSLKENGKTLDINTEKGRANREAIQKSVEAIDSWAEAFVNSGGSTDDAIAGVNLFTEGLRQQLIEAGLSEQAVDEYLTTLGRTPENVTTTISLLNEAASSRRIEEYKKQLDELPEEQFTQIEAALADGDLDEAERLLQQFTSRQRFINIGVHVTSSGMIADSTLRNELEGRGNAAGAYSDRPRVSLWGEDGAEWVAPLTKPNLMAQWLTDPRIRGPVVAGLMAGGPGTMGGMVAMASGGLVGAAGSRSSSFGAAVTTVFGSAGDAETATRGLISAVQQLGQALKDSDGDLGSHLDLVDAERDAIFRWAEAQLAAGRSTKDVSADVKYWIDDLRNQAIATGVSADAIDEYLNRIGLVPANVDTAIELVGADEAQRQLDELTKAAEDYGNTTADALERATQAVRDQRDAMLGLWGTAANIDELRSKVEANADTLGEALRRGRNLDIGTDRGRSARSALTGQLDAIFSLARGQLDAGVGLPAVQAMVDQELARVRQTAQANGVDLRTFDQFLSSVNRSGADFSTILRSLAGASRQLDQLAGATNQLDQALQSGDVAAINDAAAAGQSIVVNLTIGGNVYGDQALQQTLDDFERRVAAAIRSR